ncbi:MAG TPA: hypothetical protein VN962_08100 [Polyangia bacterium]|nr:hypothetical protein [Polyangia bacterium]
MVAIAAGCGASYGGPAPLSDFPKPSLTVSHQGAGNSDSFSATLDFDDIDWCDVLESDAFARLNGRSVPLFRGEVRVIPPQGDDGGVECRHPSVTLDQVPSDLSAPWTFEIGDSSRSLSATFAAAPIGPVVLSNPVLTNAALTLALQRQAGDTTVINGQATLSASDGQSTVSSAEAGQDGILFPTFTALFPPGPVTAAVVLNYFSADQLLDCQAPRCTLAMGSGVSGVPTTSTFTVQLVTPAD